jgi:hypothetical protein
MAHAEAFPRTLISSIFTMSASSTWSTGRATSCRVPVVYVTVSQQVTRLGQCFGRTSTSFVSTIRYFESTIPHFKSAIQHFESVIRHFKSVIRGFESAISPFSEPVQIGDSKCATVACECEIAVTQLHPARRVDATAGNGQGRN